MLRARAVTSAQRFRRDGYLRRSARNLACLALYFLGVSTGGHRPPLRLTVLPHCGINDQSS